MFVFKGMELTEVLEAKMNLGQRQGAGKGGDFKCIGPRGAILMVLRVDFLSLALSLCQDVAQQ